MHKAPRKILMQLGRALKISNYRKLLKERLAEDVLDELYLSGLQETDKNYSKHAI